MRIRNLFLLLSLLSTSTFANGKQLAIELSINELEPDKKVFVAYVAESYDGPEYHGSLLLSHGEIAIVDPPMENQAVSLKILEVGSVHKIDLESLVDNDCYTKLGNDPQKEYMSVLKLNIIQGRFSTKVGCERYVSSSNE